MVRLIILHTYVPNCVLCLCQFITEVRVSYADHMSDDTAKVKSFLHKCYQGLPNFVLGVCPLLLYLLRSQLATTYIPIVTII